MKINLSTVKKILKLPELAKEKKFINSKKFEILRQKAAKQTNIHEDRIISIDSNYLNAFDYYKERMLLEYICEEISKEFNTKYPNREAVFKEFLKVNFTCDHLTVIKLVDSVFGKDTFRCLEKLDKSDDSILSVLYELRTKRREMLKL